MKRWYYKLPGEVYANGPMTAESKEQVREWLRKWLEVKRLPRGTEVWIAS